MPKNRLHDADSPTECDRSAGSTLRLNDPNGSYKCYDPIPTPSPISPAQAKNALAAAELLQRSTSLDSLHNSSDNSSEDGGDPSSDSDSIFGVRELNGSADPENCHRQSDLVMLKQVAEAAGSSFSDAELQKSYLEHSHKKCDYKDCSYKKQDQNGSRDKSKSGRRNSITSAISMAKMETILEEPIEAKVSVKEILARFETLREAAEVVTILTL